MQRNPVLGNQLRCLVVFPRTGGSAGPRTEPAHGRPRVDWGSRQPHRLRTSHEPTVLPNDSTRDREKSLGVPQIGVTIRLARSSPGLKVFSDSVLEGPREPYPASLSPFPSLRPRPRAGGFSFPPRRPRRAAGSDETTRSPTRSPRRSLQTRTASSPWRSVEPSRDCPRSRPSASSATCAGIRPHA